MRNLWTVIEFTIKDMIKRKSFIISTLIILLMIVLGINIPNILEKINNDDTGSKILVVDSGNIFEGKLELLKQTKEDITIEIQNEEINKQEIKTRIENNEIDNAIIVEKDGNKITIKYVVQNSTMMDGVPQELIAGINSIYTNMQIEKLELTQEEIQSISPQFEYVLEQTEEQEAKGNIIAIMLLSIVLFYAIYFCAYQVSSSITTEKTSRIMETLVTSTTPKTIVLGKTIGIGIVGLVQICVIVGVALITAQTCLDSNILNSIFDMSYITPYLAIITIIYFILGYLVYSLLYALTGSTVSKPEDIQSANGPIAMIAVVGFYLSYFTMMNPTSTLNVFASMLPISSPFCMPFRVMMGLAGIRDVIISILILIVTILIIAKVAIKIYSNAILNYGKKMSLKEIIKIYKDKKN